VDCVSRKNAPAPNTGLSAIYSCRYFSNSQHQQVLQCQNVLTVGRTVHLSPLLNSEYTCFRGWCRWRSRQEIPNHSDIIVHVTSWLGPSFVLSSSKLFSYCNSQFYLKSPPIPPTLLTSLYRSEANQRETLISVSSTVCSYSYSYSYN